MHEPRPKADGATSWARLLHHDDPAQLPFQFAETVEKRTYLQHGVMVGDGDVVLDVGANVGVAAAFFASECGAGTVHCFEPVAPIFRLLRDNLRSFPSCHAHNFGLSSSSGTAEITYYPGADAMSSLYADPGKDRAVVRRYMVNSGTPEQEVDRALAGRYEPVTMQCQLRTLSSVLREESIERVDLLKLDVEKAELDVLRGVGDADWPRIRQVVAELHDDHDEVARVLRDHGFTVTTEQDPMWAGTPIRMLYATRGTLTR